MRRISVLLSAVVGLVAALLIAAPAQAATYGVTLTVSTPNADVGQTIKLTGAVSGSKAAKKTLTVQRRVNGGAWSKVGTVKTDKKKKYSFKHKVSAVGATEFRVIAPKKGSTKQGVSPLGAFTGWTWLNLATQPHLSTPALIWGDNETVADDVYGSSIRYLEAGYVMWNLSNFCNAGDIKLGSYDGAGATYSANVETSEGSAPYTVQPGEVKVADHVRIQAEYLKITQNSGIADLLLLSPRVHCYTPRLQVPEV